MNAKRLEWVDCLKGIGIIFVLLGHVGGSFVKAGLYTNSMFMQIIGTTVSIFHMKLFFAISGYTFCYAYCRHKEGNIEIVNFKRCFIQSVNFVMLYILFDVIRFVMKTIFSSFVNETMDLGMFLRTWYIAVDETWYLYAIALVYLVTMLIGRWDKANWKVLFFVSLAVSLAYSLIDPQLEWTCLKVLQYYFYFLFGMALCINLFNITSPKHVSYLRLFEAVAACGGGIAYVMIFDDCNILAWISGFMIVDILFFVFSSKNIGWSIFSKVGRHSLELYVFHMFFVSGMRPIIKILQINNWILGFSLTALVGFTGPLLISKGLNFLGLDKIVFRPFSYILNRRNA